MTTLSNRPIYDEAINQARLFGDNTRAATGNKRRMCVRLVEAAVVEGQAVETGITDAKAAMKWSKLDSSEQNKLQKDFGYVRTIVSNWPLVQDDERALFFGDKLTPSSFAATLVKREADRLAALEKEEEDARLTEEGKQDLPPAPEPEVPQGSPEAGPSELIPAAEVCPALPHATALLDMLKSGTLLMTDELAMVLMELRATITQMAEVALPEDLAA